MISKDPAWSFELGPGGFPTGRLRHRNGNVMWRTGAGWKGVAP